MKNTNQYFNIQSTANRLYFTSDQLAFFDEQNAINHAMQLCDKTISAMTREQVDQELQEMINDRWERDALYEPLDDLDSE